MRWPRYARREGFLDALAVVGIVTGCLALALVIVAILGSINDWISL